MVEAVGLAGEMVERVKAAFLADMRDRKFLKYLFAEEPETRAAYGYIDQPFDRGVQDEIADSIARAAIATMREPTEAMLKRGGEAYYEHFSVTSVDVLLARVFATMLDAGSEKAND